MDLALTLQDLSTRIPKLQAEGLVKTEEGAKNALVMPFIRALGYDVFNPLEVTPEQIADVGIKKGEKVDYAIIKNGKPAILFECKGFGVDLNNVHASQLFRYFTTTSVRFGVLTNGIVYRFYSDLVAPNKMDELPFFTFDLLNYNDSQVETLRQFSKGIFDEAATVSNAINLKYRNALRQYIDTLFADPSDAFVKMAVKESKAYEGVITQTVVAQFSKILQSVLQGYTGDQVDRRLKAALASRNIEPEPPAAETAPVPEVQPAPEDSTSADSKVVTTLEEMDAFFAVKSIVREVIPVKRVTLRDAQSYCAILFDDNNRKPLCRLYFNGKQKHVMFFTGNGEEKLAIATVDDLYLHADKLKASALHYATPAKT